MLYCFFSKIKISNDLFPFILIFIHIIINKVKANKKIKMSEAIDRRAIDEWREEINTEFSSLAKVQQKYRPIGSKKWKGARNGKQRRKRVMDPILGENAQMPLPSTNQPFWPNLNGERRLWKGGIGQNRLFWESCG